VYVYFFFGYVHMYCDTIRLYMCTFVRLNDVCFCISELLNFCGQCVLTYVRVRMTVRMYTSVSMYVCMCYA
jgi:hypothetical protein